MARRKPRVEQAEIVHRFGARLRELRISRGMTQAELAQRASVTTSHVWKLESGGSAAGIDVVERLAKALGAPVADLLPSDSPATAAVLRERCKQLFDVILQSDNKEVLLALNPMLACLVESIRRRT
jgi:transcriptional regulator with XRE-family HTH domain